MKHARKALLLVLAMAAIVLGTGGCATHSERENLSSRPWNSPRGWEYGVPGMMPQYGR